MFHTLWDILSEPALTIGRVLRCNVPNLSVMISVNSGESAAKWWYQTQLYRRRPTSREPSAPGMMYLIRVRSLNLQQRMELCKDGSKSLQKNISIFESLIGELLVEYRSRLLRNHRLGYYASKCNISGIGTLN